MSLNQESYLCRKGTPPLLETTIPAHFQSIEKKYSQREAVVSLPQNRRLTYGQLSEEIDRLAKGLMGLGFGRGNRIGIWSTNNIEWLLLQMATARIGAVLVNINPAYKPAELAYALRKSEVQALFVIPGFRVSNYVATLAEVVTELKKSSGQITSTEFPFLQRVVLYDPRSPAETLKPFPGFTVWKEVIASGEALLQSALESVTASLQCHDPINIQYTSGTTGFPKAVVLSHRNILNNAFFTAQAMHFGQKDRLCVSVPFYHCFGMVLANLLCLSVGACIVIPCEHFDAGQVLQAVDQEKCTAIHGVPTMFIAELEHHDFNRYDMSSLRTGIMAGAPCPPSLMTRIIEEMHCRDILIGYGETEASPITHLTTREDSIERRITTVGRNLPHQEVKIVNVADGATVPVGEVGEICFRGYHIMQGYYGDPEATVKAVDEEGWLYSGDLGRMDSEGYVQITGRLKEMIIRGGENIYPREIEEVLITHPDVVEAAVFGVPDDYYGEEIMAWIRLRHQDNVTEDTIREFCRDKMAHFKVPHYIRFVSEFPMTVTGKIQKFRMREIAVAERGNK
ncbi:MAG: AMP-binding protein [Desulfobulbaceae bacterium]|uniref:AMP-binding protein n=1 Tax=Candidatus Desulfobia pelagia TaxID=2841692 RepID=A0A8J6NB23_9BACT|nr:AMP-binding protein [Candidatus Desulfobia pelagia]